jgi:predicted DNA-binding transcriptional regulator AlpA
VEDLITESEAAERLSLSVRTLADMRRAGEGPRWHDLGSGVCRPVVRYRQSDIDAWLESRAKQ